MEAAQAERAAEDARLRELYPLPEDDQEFENEPYDEHYSNNGEQSEDLKENEALPTEERTR